MKETPEEMAKKVLEHLSKPKVRRLLRRQQKRTDNYFKELREALTPTDEQLHRRFTI